MQLNEVKQRTKQLGQFGDLLLKRYSHNLATHRTGDLAAKRLGRYLRAARVNAGLTSTALAYQARLPLAVVLALETGLIPAHEIEAGWLAQLAAALAENVDDLRLVLGPQVQQRPSWAWLKALQWPRLDQPARPLVPEIRLPLRSIYAAGLLMAVVCLVVVAVQLSAPKLPETTFLTKQQQRTGYHFHIEPVQRLGLITAESTFRNRVWIQERRDLPYSPRTPRLVAGSDFDLKPPPIGLPWLGYGGTSETPERLNMLQAERQLKIAALIQPAYAPVSIAATCCGVQP
jgi:hypothetical protein